MCSRCHVNSECGGDGGVRRNPAEKKTPFNQLSYTHKGRSRSEYVRPENLAAVTSEVETYKKFKLLVEEVTELSLEASRLRHKRE